MKKFAVSGNQYREIDKRMSEIKNTLSQDNNSLDPDIVLSILKQTIEGKFTKASDGIIEAQIKAWEMFYRACFGIKVDFSNINIPQKKDGFEQLIIAIKEMTSERLFEKCHELFYASKYPKLVLSKVKSSRLAKNAYAIWVRKGIEPDDGLEKMSARDLNIIDLAGITLEERLLYELMHFTETGSHLDLKNKTLCSGSHCFPDSYVPTVNWKNMELAIGRANDDSKNTRLRPRIVSFHGGEEDVRGVG